MANRRLISLGVIALVAAIVAVLQPAAPAAALGVPVISTQPPADTYAVLGGSSVSVTSAATGSPTPTVQWEVSTDGGSTWSNVSGQTSATLTGVSLTDLAQVGTRYRAAYTNSFGTTRTSATILRRGIAPVVTQDPTPSGSFVSGQPVTLGVAATGTPAPTVQWKVCNGCFINGTNVSGATSTSLTVTPTTKVYYYATFTNAVGSTNTQILYVSSTGLGITFFPELASQSAGDGDVVTFTASANAYPAPTYQWQRQAVGATSPSDIPGETGASLSVVARASDSGAKYRVVATNASTSRASALATLTVGPSAPAITTHPANRTATTPNQVVQFTAAASGSPMPTVAWERSTDGGSTWNAISGATIPTLTVTTQASDDGNRYRAVFTNAQGSATTNPATLTVGTVPSNPTITPMSATVANGDTASFAATVDGYPTPTLTWQRSLDGGATWSTLPGQTGSTLSFTVADADHGARYRFEATNQRGKVTSQAATLTGTAPAFVQDLSTTNVNVAVGSSKTLTVVASGAPAPTYAWQAYYPSTGTWLAVANATGPSLTFTASPSSGRAYRVTATNRLGSTTSAVTPVTVGYAPVRRSSPESLTVTSGQTASFFSRFSYFDNADVEHGVLPRWERSTDGGATWTPVGAVANTLSVPTTLAASGDRFRAIAENDFGSAMSLEAVLTVVGGPKVTASPADVGLAEPRTVTFTSAAIGEPDPTVRWQRGPSSTGPWTDIEGATSPTLTFDATTADDGTFYRAVWTNSAGSKASEAAFLRFGLPVITDAPPSTVYYGHGGVPVTVSAAATGSPTPTLRWYSERQGSRVNRGTGSSVTLGAPFVADATYYVEATNEVGTVRRGFTLVEGDDARITAGPSDLAIGEGAQATFTSAGTGTPTPSIQWQRSDDGGASWDDLAGENAPDLTFTAALADSGARFRVRYVNSFATAESSPATLTVEAVTPPPAVTDQPDDAGAYAGDPVSFTAAASGLPAPTVQWQRSDDAGDTWADVPGATVTTLTFTAAPGDDGARFRAVFTAPSGSTPSDAATLSILTPAAASILSGPGDASGPTGTPVSFSVAAAGSPTPTVQWQVKSGDDPLLSQWTNLPGATSPVLTFTPTTSNYFDRYRAVVTNRFGSATSPAAALILTDPPQITRPPADASVTSGQTAHFTAAVTEERRPSVTYRWERSTDAGETWTAVAGASTTELDVPGVTRAADGDRYRIVATNAFGASTSDSATLTVSGAPVVVTQPQAVKVADGATATLSAAAIGEPVPTVQWQRSADGSSPWTDVPGATTSPYSFTAELGDAGFYRARFTNSAGSAASAVVKVDVGVPVFTSAPDEIAYVAGQPVTVSAAATGAPAPTITWWGEWLDTNHFCDEEQQERCPIVRHEVIGTGSTVTLTPPYPARDYYVVAQNSLGTTKHAISFVEQPAPTITGSRSASPNGAGWYNQPVTVSFTCTSTALAACSPPVAVGGDGAGQSVTGTAVDTFGQVATTTVSGIDVDTTAPTISGASTTPANAGGGYFGSVTVRWTCADALSGISLCPADQTVSGEGTHVVSGVAIDKAGNTTTADVTIRIDHDTSQDPGIVHGRITDRVSGQPVAGVTVALHVPPSATAVYTAVTGTDGTYIFPAVADGTYVLSATHWGYHLQAWYPNTTDLANAGRFTVSKGTNRTIDQTVAPGYVVSGQLRSSATGLPVGGATVRLQGAGTEGYAVTDALGRYSITGLLAGTRTITVYAYGYSPLVVSGVVVTPGGTTVDRTLAPVPTSPGIKGRITIYGTSTPIAGATVRVWLKGAFKVETSVVTGSDGRFTIPSMPVGDYEVDVVRSAYPTRWFGDTPGRTGAATVTLTTGCATAPDLSWGDPCATPVNIAMRKP